MKQIAKRLYESLLASLVSMRLHSVAGLLATVATTVNDGRRTIVRWDGEDWEFTWSDGCLIWTSPLLSPRRATECNIEQYLVGFELAQGDVVLDVGAGNGTEVCTFSNMVGPSGRVIAIEADPDAARLLRKQADRLRYRNVEVLQVAAGEGEGSVYLSIAEPGWAQNSVTAVVGNAGVTVPSRPLADIMEELGIRSAAYMKMNIEGAEYDALVGLGSGIGNIKQMFVSCHDFTGVPSQQTYDKVHQHLSGAGLLVTQCAAKAAPPWERFYLYARWPDC